MKPLTQERLREVLDYNPNTGVFIWKVATANAIKVGSVAGATEGSGYTQIQIDTCLYHAKRLAWLYVFGRWPNDQIDHINGDRQDDRIANLRDVSVAENNMNQRIPSNNTSGVMGVSWRECRKKWHAQIGHKKKKIFLGYYKTLSEAISARKAAERQYGFHMNHGRV